MHTHLLLDLSVEDANQQMHLFFLVLSLPPCSLLDLLSSLAPSFNRQSCTRSPSFPPPLLAVPHASAEQQGASLHHWLSSLSPASAPFAHRPVTSPPSRPQCSQQQQNLPPTPWIINESASVFSFDWRVQRPDLRQSLWWEQYWFPAKTWTSCLYF